MTPPIPSITAADGARDDARPVVPTPSSGPPLVVIIAGFLVLAVVLFIVLESNRHAAVKALGPARQLGDGQVLEAPPTLEVPPPPRAPPPEISLPPPPPEIRYVDRPGPSPPPIIQYVERPAMGLPPPPPPAMMLGKLTEPALVIDLGEGTANPGPNEEAAARATVLRNRSALVSQGSLIPAVLETPIDSTRPGPVRALTSADTRGFDGSKVLIPRGSRLVGEFKADVQAGQRRVLVTWNRLVRPDGVAIRLISPATDTVGGTGIAGDVNTHALARIGSVALQTALTIGVNLASRPGDGSVVVGLPGQVASGSGQTLLPSSDFKPTITVKEGAAITVFVVRDLDFGRAVPRQ
jgi:type IV secretion system protein VirB10